MDRVKVDEDGRSIPRGADAAERGRRPCSREAAENEAVEVFGMLCLTTRRQSAAGMK